MAVQGVNFGNEQQKQSSGVVFPVLGAAAGAGVTAFTKFGKKPLAIEGLTADKFEKSAEGATLEGDHKTAFETVKAYLTKKEAKTPESEKAATPAEDKKSEVKTDKPATTTEPKVKVNKSNNPKSVATGVELNDIFDNGKTELKYDEYLANKYGAYDVQSLMDKIKDSKAEITRLAGDPSKPSKEMKAAQYNLNAVKNFSSTHTEYLNVQAKKVAIQSEIDSLTAAQKGLDSKSPKYVSNQKRIDGLNKNIATIDKQLQTLDEKTTAIKAKVPTIEEFAPDKAAIDQMLDKATKDGGRMDIVMTKVAKAKVKELQDLAEAEARKDAKANKKTLTPEEIKEIREKITVDHPQVVEASISAGGKKGTELSIDAIKNQAKAFYEKQISCAENDLNKVTKSFGRKKAAVAEMEADLQLVRDARKNGTTITKTASEGVVKTNIAKVAESVKASASEAASKVPESVTKAFETLTKADKLKPGMNGKNILIGTGIGLVAGILAKFMADGSSKSEA